MENDAFNRRSNDIALLGKDVAMLRSVANKMVGGRRAFLIPQTAVSTTIIAGLLIFMTTIHDYDWHFIFGAILFALHVVVLHVYMTALLSLEGRKLDHELKLFDGIKKEYVKMIERGMADRDILILIRDERAKLKYAYKALEFFSHEELFLFVNALFISAFLWLFFTFLCRIAR